MHLLKWDVVNWLDSGTFLKQTKSRARYVNLSLNGMTSDENGSVIISVNVYNKTLYQSGCSYYLFRNNNHFSIL